MSEPRPKFTGEIALRAALATADDLIRDGHVGATEREDAAEQIVNAALGPYADGYSLAKHLDDTCYWDCNLEIANCLDGFSSHATAELRLAEKAWAERNWIIAPLPKGSRVKLKSGETGEIDGIYEYGSAQFLVKIDGDRAATGKSKSRRIVNFEDAALLEVDIGAVP